MGVKLLEDMNLRESERAGQKPEFEGDFGFPSLSCWGRRLAIVL